MRMSKVLIHAVLREITFLSIFPPVSQMLNFGNRSLAPFPSLFYCRQIQEGPKNILKLWLKVRKTLKAS
jgi:hypothetical protein